MGKVKKAAAPRDDTIKKIGRKSIVKKEKQKNRNKKNVLELSGIEKNLNSLQNISKKKQKQKQKQGKVGVGAKGKMVVPPLPSKDKTLSKKKQSPAADKKVKPKTSVRKKNQAKKKEKELQVEIKQKTSKKNKKMKQPTVAEKKQHSENSVKAAKVNKKRLKGKQKTGKEAKIEKLEQLKKKQQKQLNSEKKRPSEVQAKNSNMKVNAPKQRLNLKKLEKVLATQPKDLPKKNKNIKPQTLRERMMSKLKASRFRYLNETLYNSNSAESKKYFKDDPDAFTAYHDGYKQQIEQWPLNPLDKIISSIQKLPKDYVIADFGCGEATLAESVPQKVNSFDFVSLNKRVTVCDMAHTPLLTNGANVVVFCLSLMGTNLNDYLKEANRVLKTDGILKIAEVESRFDKVEDFIAMLNEYGFKLTWKDLSHNLFYFMDFRKVKDLTGKKKSLPQLTLKPCLYKKR